MSGPRYVGTNLLEDVFYGVANFLDDVSDKLGDIVENIKVDEKVLETLPYEFHEKPRKERPHCPFVLGAADTAEVENGILPHDITELLIPIQGSLAGFDEISILGAKKHIIEAARFIVGHVETGEEKCIAVQIVKMLRQGTIRLTNTQGEMSSGYFNWNDEPNIGLDIGSILEQDEPFLIDTLAHEACHAYCYYEKDTEYSIIDETRAWNMGLHFSNKYRVLHSLALNRDTDYTEMEVMTLCNEYLFGAANVKVRLGKGENIIENIGFGIANWIDDLAEKIEDLTDKMF
jgi:hypothetical protein